MVRSMWKAPECLWLTVLEFYKKYAKQFKVLKSHNQELRKYQKYGITPAQYISVVGRVIENGQILSIEDSIEKIRPYFIHG